jgi:hypothetical protein
MQKNDFPLYNTNKKIKLVTKNKEPKQKHAKLIYCILFTWKRNKQLSDYLLLLIPYFAFWHIRTVVVRFNEKKIQSFKNIYVFFILSWILFRRGVLDTTVCDKACQWLAEGRRFSPVSSTIKTDHHDIAEILLKVVLNTIP